MHKRILRCQLILACLFITLPRVAQATDENRQDKAFIFDHYWSPNASSSMIISSRALLNEAEDFVFRTKYAHYNIWGRMATTVLNNIFNNFLTLVNHEVNGHGFRARSLGIPVSRYSLTLLGGGAMYFKSSYIRLDELLLIDMGGTEANNVLAQQLLFKSFQKLSLESRTCGLFLEAYLDLPAYISSTYFSETARNEPGNDIACYLKEINTKHNTDSIGIDKLMEGSLLFLCNPILYIALWAQLDYLFTGTASFPIPHFKLGHINYMPLIRMGLTPFGLMYYLENYMGHGNKTFLMSINGGNSLFYTRGYGGIQLQTDGLWGYKNYGLDVTGNLWCQPKLQLEDKDQLEDKNYWGGLIGINNKFKLGEFISLNASISYKSTGFVEGVVANSGFLFSGGFSLHY